MSKVYINREGGEGYPMAYWGDAQRIYVKDTSAWKRTKRIYVHDGESWKRTYTDNYYVPLVQNSSIYQYELFDIAYYNYSYTLPVEYNSVMWLNGGYFNGTSFTGITPPISTGVIFKAGSPLFGGSQPLFYIGQGYSPVYSRTSNTGSWLYYGDLTGGAGSYPQTISRPDRAISVSGADVFISSLINDPYSGEVWSIELWKCYGVIWELYKSYAGGRSMILKGDYIYYTDPASGTQRKFNHSTLGTATTIGSLGPYVDLAFHGDELYATNEDDVYHYNGSSWDLVGTNPTGEYIKPMSVNGVVLLVTATGYYSYTGGRIYNSDVVWDVGRKDNVDLHVPFFYNSNLYSVDSYQTIHRFSGEITGLVNA